MAQNNRFIKIWGGIKDWEWADDLEMVGFWVHLLMAASWQDKEWRGITVKRGQLIFGRCSWAKKLKISEKRVRTFIKRLKETGEIVVETASERAKKDPKNGQKMGHQMGQQGASEGAGDEAIKGAGQYSVLTIVNYEKYQSQDNNGANKRASKGPANGHKKGQQNGQQGATSLERVEEVEGRTLPPIIPQGGCEGKGESEPKPEKTQRVKKEPEAPLDIPHFIPEDLLFDFFANRKAIKKPMTHRAKELFLNKIIALYHQGHDPTKLLATAIERGWQTVYESNDTLNRGNHENTQRLNPKHPKPAYDNRSAWERQRDKNFESIARLQAEVDAEDIAMGKTPSPRTEEGFGRFW